MWLTQIIISAGVGVVGYLMFSAILDRHIETMSEVIRLIGG
jgi:hypothetical protein